jgi:hypothetical protein
MPEGIMEKILESITLKFKNPLSLLFFILGAILTLLGLVSNLEFSNGKIEPNPNYQVVSLILGAGCLLLAVLFYKHPSALVKKTNTEQTLPTELTFSFLERKLMISNKQREILEFVEIELAKIIDAEKYLYLNKIQEKFEDIPLSELYYRLEQLRLLGFVDVRKFNASEATHTRAYCLSKKYKSVSSAMPHPEKTSSTTHYDR